MDLFSSPPPLAPPTSEGNEVAQLRLLRSRRVGASTYHRLMREHAQDANVALEALSEVALKSGLKDYTPCSIEAAQQELAKGRKHGAVSIFFNTQHYPEALAELSDPPPFLWAKGDLSLLGKTGVALVGARNASSLGLRMARLLARGLGEAGVPVISGLARGIDAAAHDAALKFGTVAVVAGGIDTIYPAENAKLTAQIAQNGLLLTEMPPGVKPQARHFPRRNRVISGLACGVVVVEAAPKSGSLITARDALDQGREVLAVPGHPFEGRAAGCNLLLREGATLVRGPDDVIEALGLQSDRQQKLSGVTQTKTACRVPFEPAPKGPVSPPNEDHAAALLSLLGATPIPEEALVRDLGLSAQTAALLLVDLELDGHVTRHPGGLVSRA